MTEKNLIWTQPKNLWINQWQEWIAEHQTIQKPTWVININRRPLVYIQEQAVTSNSKWSNIGQMGRMASQMLMVVSCIVVEAFITRFISSKSSRISIMKRMEIIICQQLLRLNNFRVNVNILLFYISFYSEFVKS